MQNKEAQTVRGFSVLVALEFKYYEEIYKEPDRENIAEIIKITTHFP